jgi:exopolysaccharide biosynthesis polyprenyl glycosylphosphotransferase
MLVSSKKESFILFLGDIAALALSLFLALVIRYGGQFSASTFINHVIPFSYLFAVSILVYFVAGLYDKHTLVLTRRIPQTLVNVQIVNAIIAVAFFYFIPYFDINPKTFLFIYLLLALVFTSLWRISYLSLFRSKKKQPALLIGEGNDVSELFNEINNNSRYGIQFVEWSKKADTSIVSMIKAKNITLVAADFNDPSVRASMPELYRLIFSGIEFFDIRDLYEDIFDRVALSRIDDAWCLEHMSSSSKTVFDFIKRTIDVVVSGLLAVVSLLVYPFVYIAIKMDDGGVIFSYQTRVGERDKPVSIMKFRTMSVANDDGKWGKASGKEARPNVITRVGSILRKSRIDELPQLWNVLKGDISLIGPRPEFPDPVALYSAQIPYYNLRHIVKPGLSGWAQIYHEKHPHHGIDTQETANKLSYDLYYIKNRSFLLDMKIALRTMKVLLSFAGK